MTLADENLIVSFLQDCSEQSLGDFVLAKLNRDAQLRKQLAALLETAIENRALYLLGSLLRTRGAELQRGARD